MTNYDNIGWTHFTSIGFGVFFVFYFYMMIKYNRIKFEASKIKYLIILLILFIFFGLSVGISTGKINDENIKATTKIGLFVFIVIFSFAFVNARYNYINRKRGLFYGVPIIQDVEEYFGQSFNGVFDYELKDIVNQPEVYNEQPLPDTDREYAQIRQ